MKYTVYPNKVDDVIERDLDIIKKKILAKHKLVSIILFGGFGKGEGSVEIKDGKVIPLNDYDLYLIGNDFISESEIEKLGEACSKAIGKGGLDYVEHPDEEYSRERFFHVDLRFIHYKNLGKLLPTQRTYELKHGSQVIYGQDVRSLIPEVKVPISEGIRILFNKMDHLMLAENEKSDIRKIYIMKSYLDLCAALLMLEDDFYGIYRERNKAFMNHDYPKELKEKVDWATNLKVKPDFSKIDDMDYEDAKYWVGWSLMHILNKKFGIEKDWDEVAKFIHSKLSYSYFDSYLKHKFFFPAQYYLTLRYVLRCWRKGEKIIKPLFSWKDVGLKLAVPLILYMYGDKDNAKTYLGKISGKTEPLRERILKLYGLYYLQKII